MPENPRTYFRGFPVAALPFDDLSATFTDFTGWAASDFFSLADAEELDFPLTPEAADFKFFAGAGFPLPTSFRHSIAL